jgi:hypothetical protein
LLINNRKRHPLESPFALPRASFISIGLDPTEIDKCNKKIMIASIRDPNLFLFKNNVLMIGMSRDSESINYSRDVKSIRLFGLLFYLS